METSGSITTGSKDLRVREGDISWQLVDDQVIVLDLRQSCYIQINAAGAILFERLADGADEASLVAALAERFGLDDDAAARDVSAFLHLMRKHDLLAPST